MLDARGTGVPVIVHWGADVGDLSPADLTSLADASVPAVSHSAVDRPVRLSVLPHFGEGFGGTPALSGSGIVSPLVFSLVGLSRVADGVDIRLSSGPPESAGLQPGGGASGSRDSGVRLSVLIELRLSAEGVLRSCTSVTNDSAASWSLNRVGVTLPLPARARELLDFGGRWSFERRPQRQLLQSGTLSRAQRHGRTGHDSPFLTVAGTPGFGFRRGEVWAMHLGWSGDHEIIAETAPTGHALLGAAELLQPGEVVLEQGASYHSPWVYAAWSDSGLDGISARMHAFQRARRAATRGALPPRPLFVNTWEAVYFDHDLAKLSALAELAASVGTERFVLDDGWMIGRVDATRALGDWVVDPERYPHGLHPLVDRVHELGMQFGLWVEPEMVSLDSLVARQHPEWVLAADQLSWRDQHAIDLGNPDAFAHVLGQLDALLDEYPIVYLKWDQNRDLLGSSSHRQTTATYRLMEELRARHPGLEIESCSSGGARVDLGVLEHTDRIWASDTNDPLERQAIHRYTSLLVPPELIGSHLGAPRAHITGRVSDLSFRLVTALFWSAGIEWNLGDASPAELDAIREWSALYRSWRSMLHSGTTVRADATDAGIEVHGVVAAAAVSGPALESGPAAVFAVVCLIAPRDSVGSVILPGLEPDARYRVSVVALSQNPHVIHTADPPWMATGITLTGSSLGQVGLAMPSLAPAQALLLRLDRV